VSGVPAPNSSFEPTAEVGLGISEKQPRPGGLIQVLANIGESFVIGFKNKTAIAVIAAFGVGLAVGNLPTALATSGKTTDLAHKTFTVSIDEVKKNFVFGDEFSGTYTKTVTMSDGTQRQIELTPMVHDGMQVIRLKDTGGLTYMSLNGTTTNGKLMIQIEDKEASLAALKAQGWK